MDRELMSMLGTLQGGLNAILGVVVLVLGLVLVRPKHATAGVALAAAGGARLLGIGVFWLFGAMSSKDGGYDAVMGMALVSSLVSLLFSIAFWGGIVFAALQMAEAINKRGAS
jgi:hypothetical protein